MIDKLEITVDAEVPLRKEIESKLSSVRKIKDPEPYQKGFELEDVGLPASLFRRCRYNGTQRLCVKRVSGMTVQQISEVIGQVFNSDPWEVRIARLDLALDLPGISMDCIRDHVRVSHKRDVEPTGTSIYIGSGKDRFRFYDKAAEARFRGTVPLNNISSEPLSRIERQLRTARIPPQISTLSQLVRNLLYFNPFSPVRLAEGGKPEPRIQDYGARDYLSGIGLRELIKQFGYARAYQQISECAGGNVGRILTRLRDFVPPDPSGFCRLDLFAMYRHSLVRQIGEEVRF